MKSEFSKVTGNAMLDVIPAAIYAMAKGKETLELAMRLLANKQ